MYFFVSRIVLPSRVWRNKRVTATVTLFIILLDTTCEPRLVRRVRQDKQGARTVPTRERGMPAVGRSRRAALLGRRKRVRPAPRHGTPLRSSERAAGVKSRARGAACSTAGGGSAIARTGIQARIGRTYDVRRFRRGRTCNFDRHASSRNDLASLRPLILRRRRQTRSLVVVACVRIVAVALAVALVLCNKILGQAEKKR